MVHTYYQIVKKTAIKYITLKMFSYYVKFFALLTGKLFDTAHFYTVQ